jgi:Secretion system C-terminal sorting domain
MFRIFKDMMYKNLFGANFILALFVLGSLNLFSQTPPELTSPADGEKCLPRSIAFDWEIVPGATIGYLLQVSDVDGDFSSPVYQSDQITQTAEFVKLDNNLADYFWRAATITGSGTFWSESRSFTTQAAPIILTSPSDAIECQEKRMDLDWEDFDGVVSYNVQIATNIGFSNFITDRVDILSSSFSRSLPENYTTYYWRVSANYSNGGSSCQTEWSEVREYTTLIASPSEPTPGNDSIGLPLVLEISWNNVTDGIFYNFELATDDNFQNIASASYSTFLNSVNVNLGTNYNTDYYWRTQTIDDADCVSDWSSTFHFKTIAEKPILISPENEADCMPVGGTDFSWEAVSNTEGYTLQISPDIDFNPVEDEWKNISNTFKNVGLPNAGKLYYWRVRAEDDNTIGAWSDIRELKSGIFDAIIKSPSNNEEEVYIEATLQWSSRPYTSHYVQVASSASFEESSLIYDEPIIVDETYLAIMPEYNTKYYWRTSTTFGDCVSNWTEPTAFTTIKGSPDLIFPEDNATEQDLIIYFDWEDVDSAVSYRIEISTSDEVDPDNSFTDIEFRKIGFEPSTYQIFGLKPETKYYWHVRTLHKVSTGEAKKSPWSDIYEFTTGVAPSGVPFLELPEYDATKVSISPDFHWSSVENADFYNLEIALDDKFPTQLHKFGNIQSNSFSMSNASLSFDNYQTYFWRVNAENGSGPSDWSNVWEFKTIAPCVEDAVVLVSPQKDESGIKPENVTFSWFAVDNTLEYKGGYRIQIATSNTFEGDDLKIDLSQVWEEKKSFPVIEANTTIYWRVLGWNEACEGPWSEVWSFETDPSSLNENSFISNLQILPNPANENTIIRFASKQSGSAEVLVYDMGGNLVSTIYSGQIVSQQERNFSFNANKLSSGEYMLVIRTDGKIAAHKFTVIR